MNDGILDWFWKYNIESNWKKVFKIYAKLSLIRLCISLKFPLLMNCTFLIIYLAYMITTFLIGVHETLSYCRSSGCVSVSGLLFWLANFLLILLFIFYITLHQNGHFLTPMLLLLIGDDYDHWAVSILK